jgi:hypothetical protein
MPIQDLPLNTHFVEAHGREPPAQAALVQGFSTLLHSACCKTMR